MREESSNSKPCAPRVTASADSAGNAAAGEDLIFETLPANLPAGWSIHDVNALYTFPIIFAISGIGCLAGTFLSTAEDDAILKKFYKTVNPWGFWGPIREQVRREDRTFQPNHNFVRDMTNVLVGALKNDTKILRNAHRYAGFVVLKSVEFPSVLVETAFINNPAEARLLANSEFQRQIGRQLANGVKVYFERAGVGLVGEPRGGGAPGAGGTSR